MTNDSLSFDHAADFYDATRALPELVQRQVTDGILAEISRLGADELLEVGVGTGRMARPLAGHGVRVCGVDIAPRMLAKLREQLRPGQVPPDLVLGDATRLPIASGSFRAVLVVHVLHLLLAWRAALKEIRRVLTRGGILIHYNLRGGRDQWWADSRAKWEQLLASRGFAMRERPNREQIHYELRALGASCRVEAVAEHDERRTIDDILGETRDRIHSWTWDIPEGLFFGCLDDYEAWARESYGDVTGERVERVVHELEVWSFRSGGESA